MRNNIIIILVIVLLSMTFSACNKEEYKAPVSNVVEMSGRWWIQLWYDADGDGILNQDEDALLADYPDMGYDFTTSNDALNSKDSVWIVDPNGWPFQSKVAVDIASKTFKAGTFNNIDADGESVTVGEGKVLKLGGLSLSGKKVDSIYLKLEFSDDPGETYFYSGIKYTGHSEDDF